MDIKWRLVQINMIKNRMWHCKTRPRHSFLHYGDGDNIYSWDGINSTALITPAPIQGTLTLQGSAGGQTLFQTSYEHDKLGRITVKEENADRYVYQYDPAGRLIQVQQNGIVSETYGYDSNNNRTHKNGAVIATYDDQDRLLTYNGNSYTYTENGELKTKTNSGVSTNYSYDTLGNLRQVILPGDITIDYVIDGQNRRIGKKVNGQLKQGFLYKDQLNPIAELDENGNIIARFVYAEKGNVPSYLIKIDPITQVETTFRVISDHLGSPRLIVNTDDGSIAQRMDYDMILAECFLQLDHKEVDGTFFFLFLVLTFVADYKTQLYRTNILNVAAYSFLVLY